jgi:DNA-binding response OmpR family regulator
MLRILLAGSDSRLLETRAAVLSKTGAAVINRNAVETLDILDLEAFDLVVLCHSLPEHYVTVIVDKIHEKNPDTRILMVVSDIDRYGMHLDKKVDATCVPSPERLIARVKELLQGTSYGSRECAEARGRVGHTRLAAS